MIIEDILTPSRTLCSVRGASKKKILEVIARLISEAVPAINAKDLFTSLVSRERLGTTALGEGVAIPHCKSKSCTKPTGLFIRLARPVDFESADQKPVDLLFALIVPDEQSLEHEAILQVLTTRFRSGVALNKMRTAHNPEELYECIVSTA